MKACPYCAEEIQDAAIVCRHCGRDIPTIHAWRCESCGHGFDQPDNLVIDGRPLPVCPSCQAGVGSTGGDEGRAPLVLADQHEDRSLVRGGWRLVAVSLIFPVAYLAAFVVGLVAIVRGQVVEPVVMMLAGAVVAGASMAFWASVLA